MGKICLTEFCGSYTEGGTDYCGSCNTRIRKIAKQNQRDEAKRSEKPKSIDKVSKKQAKHISEYSKEKGPWIEGKVCEVCFETIASDIHHQRGRLGFADMDARIKNVTLLMDKRYWLAVCRPCHSLIETNPTFARKEGFSLPRNETPN